MKRVLAVLLLCLMPLAASAEEDSRTTIFNALNGLWYFDNGGFAFDVDAEKYTVADKKVIEIKDFLGEGICSEATWVFETGGKPGEMRVAVARTGDTYLLSFGGLTTFQNKKEMDYPESILGIYLGMGRERVSALLGRPDATETPDPVIVETESGQLKSIAHLETATYTAKGLKIDYIYNRVDGITILPGSAARLDRSGLGPEAPLQNFIAAYSVDTESPRYHVADGEASLPIGENEYLSVVKGDDGKQVIYLSKWND